MSAQVFWVNIFPFWIPPSIVSWGRRTTEISFAPKLSNNCRHSGKATKPKVCSLIDSGVCLVSIGNAGPGLHHGDSELSLGNIYYYTSCSPTPHSQGQIVYNIIYWKLSYLIWTLQYYLLNWAIFSNNAGFIFVQLIWAYTGKYRPSCQSIM